MTNLENKNIHNKLFIIEKSAKIDKLLLSNNKTSDSNYIYYFKFTYTDKIIRNPQAIRDIYDSLIKK